MRYIYNQSTWENFLKEVEPYPVLLEKLSSISIKPLKEGEKELEWGFSPRFEFDAETNSLIDGIGLEIFKAKLQQIQNQGGKLYYFWDGGNDDALWWYYVEGNDEIEVSGNIFRTMGYRLAGNLGVPGASAGSFYAGKGSFKINEEGEVILEFGGLEGFGYGNQKLGDLKHLLPEKENSDYVHGLELNFPEGVEEVSFRSVNNSFLADTDDLLEEDEERSENLLDWFLFNPGTYEYSEDTFLVDTYPIFDPPLSDEDQSKVIEYVHGNFFHFLSNALIVFAGRVSQTHIYIDVFEGYGDAEKGYTLKVST
ncbi:MAG: hypothetical protein MRZ79_20590 [Bacteroidia bacterium]|nr:hypothetical protein [Bacteroidia bacterium]